MMPWSDVTIPSPSLAVEIRVEVKRLGRHRCPFCDRWRITYAVESKAIRGGSVAVVLGRPTCARCAGLR